jgi:membrane-associated PAP2 superfamily phosphatase
MHFSDDPAFPTASPVLGHKALHPAGAAPASQGAKFYRQHLGLPLLAWAILSAWLMGLGADLWLADAIYAAGGHAWALQSSPVTQGLIHEGGRQASKWAWFAVAACLLLSLLHKPASQWRTPLAYLLLSTLLATALVGAMKRGTHMDCPWDLLRYGGEKAYYGLFTRRPTGRPPSRCRTCRPVAGGTRPNPRKRPPLLTTAVGPRPPGPARPAPRRRPPARTS